jgi:putative heme iron utilization protein
MPNMLPRLRVLIDLLHGCADAALATHSVALAGYPFASALPFATDERHRPVFLLSRLAEHTQNLAVDARASLLVHGTVEDGEMPRATLLGQVRPFEPEMSLIERYQRYQPAAQKFLQLGDFRFYRLEPAQARIIGGFGQAAWLDGERLTDGSALTLDQERAAFQALAPFVPAGSELLGVDCFGIDLRRSARQVRIAFSAASTAEAIVSVGRRALGAV